MSVFLAWQLHVSGENRGDKILHSCASFSTAGPLNIGLQAPALVNRDMSDCAPVGDCDRPLTGGVSRLPPADSHSLYRVR